MLEQVGTVPRCAIPDCGKRRNARGLCLPHYLRARRTNTLPPLVPKPRWRLDPTTGCWLWLWAIGDGGYGTVGGSRSGGTRLAHRVYYERYRGPIPAGMQLDHVCRTRHCVNPMHMDVVTARANTLRGRSPSAQAVRLNRCRNGHEFTPENTGRQGVDRYCRECDRRRRHLERRAIA